MKQLSPINEKSILTTLQKSFSWLSFPKSLIGNPFSSGSCAHLDSSLHGNDDFLRVHQDLFVAAGFSLRNNRYPEL